MAIHSSAQIHPSAEIHESAEIAPNCRIGAHCVVDEGNILMDGAVLGPRTIVGKGNTFHYNCVIGHDPQFLGFDPATKSGTKIGNGNHFREFSTVHRGLKDDTYTIVGNDNFLMAYVHVAHDCVLGNNIVMVNYTGISGHCVLEDRCFLSGHAVAHQFCRVGTLAMVGGRGVIVKDVPPYMTLKHYGLLVGVNVVGMRRAGAGPEARMAVRQAYKKLFRSGQGLSHSIAEIREEYDGREMPQELKHLLNFCSEKSKRGMSRGPRPGESIQEDGDEE